MEIVVIQHIKTTWDKSARGGENAVQRNAVPEVAKLPVAQLEIPDLVLIQHDLSYGSSTLIEPTERITISPSVRPLRIGCVTIDTPDAEATVAFQYDRECGGAPERGWARKTMRVSQETWVQVVYNGRHTGGYDSFWWYEKHVVNVGLFERLSSGLFTRCAPDHRFEAMGELR